MFIFLFNSNKRNNALGIINYENTVLRMTKSTKLLWFKFSFFSFWVWLALIQMLILWWVLWLGNWESTMWVLLLLLLLFLFLLLNNWACGFSFFLSFFLFWYLIFLICFFSLLWFRDNGNKVIILASVACWLDCVMLIVLYVLSIFFFFILLVMG